MATMNLDPVIAHQVVVILDAYPLAPGVPRSKVARSPDAAMLLVQIDHREMIAISLGDGAGVRQPAVVDHNDFIRLDRLTRYRCKAVVQKQGSVPRGYDDTDRRLNPHIGPPPPRKAMRSRRSAAGLNS
jgi:hypothetical protein